MQLIGADICIAYCKHCGCAMWARPENVGKEHICHYCCSSNQYGKIKHQAKLYDQQQKGANNQ